jgi:hypothetical protein
MSPSLRRAAVAAIVILIPRAAESSESRVHIESPSPVTLERRASGEAEWTIACQSPCDAAVTTDSDFRVTGADVRSSAPFTLRPGREAIALRVRPAARSVRTLSIAGIVVGGTGSIGALLVGQAMETASALEGIAGAACGLTSANNIYGSAAERPSCTRQHESFSWTPYLVTSAIGAVLAVSGIVGVVSNGRTTVSSPDASSVDESPPKERLPSDATPEGVARLGPVAPSSAVGTGAQMSIFSMSF